MSESPRPESSEPRDVVLCADDFGISPGVNRAILDLLEKRRLSAVSCMSVFPEFAADATRLRGHAEHASLGLHLTLTHERSLGAVMRDAYAGRIDRAAMAREVERQMSLFGAATNRQPDFIDGHQHVHALPGIREAVVETAVRFGIPVRVLTAPSIAQLVSLPAAGKSLGLSVMGRWLSRRAQAHGVAANAEFRGVRSFTEPEPYRALFVRLIKGAPNRCLVMCHPGLPDDVLAARDGIQAQRRGEYGYLASDEFPLDLAAAGLRLARIRLQATVAAA